jgi:hypothetical protein
MENKINLSDAQTNSFKNYGADCALGQNNHK